MIEGYWKELFCFAEDEEPKVRLSFIWASENIATNTPEIFRVLGKRRPHVEALLAGTLDASGEANCAHHDHEEAHGHSCGHGKCHG